MHPTPNREIPLRSRLLKLAQALPLFLSKDNQPYVSCPTPIPLYSEDFFGWLFSESRQRLGHYPNQYEFGWVIRTLDQQARQQKIKTGVHTRIAKLSPKTYQIDLTTDAQQGINITGKRWQHTPKFKTLFERSEIHTSLPTPEQTALTLADCFNQIFQTSPEISANLAIWLAEAFLPDRKPPILVITGKARDKAVEMLRNLIDPVHNPIIYSPGCPIELNGMALENRVLAFSFSQQPTEKLIKKLNAMHQGTRVPLTHSNKRRPKLFTTVERPIIVASREPLTLNKDQINIEINQAPDTEMGKMFYALLNLIVEIVGQQEQKKKYPVKSAPRAFAAGCGNQPQTIDTS